LLRAASIINYEVRMEGKIINWGALSQRMREEKKSASPFLRDPAARREGFRGIAILRDVGAELRAKEGLGQSVWANDKGKREKAQGKGGGESLKFL